MPTTKPDRQARQQALKEMIRRLHTGASVDEVKKEFANLLRGGDSAEIAELEQTLIAEGMPETEIQRLCDVHVAVFRESLNEEDAPPAEGGAFLRTLRSENAAAEKALSDLENAVAAGLWDQARSALVLVRKLDTHYRKKEYALFPRLEQYGFTGPTQVMWGIHDQIRSGWDQLTKLLDGVPKPVTVLAASQPLLQSIRDMIYKEEKILFPNALRLLSPVDWEALSVHREDGSGAAGTAPASEIPLQVGALTPEQIALLFTHLPVDVTYVDAEDNVRFYSGGKERIFERTPDVIGRNVLRCHPPASVHRVKRILDDFRAGERDSAEFWIQTGPEAQGGKFIHIRYFAVRDAQGKFRGTIEVTQDVTAIRKLQGERRLLAEGE
jgi:uncharacterized protein